MCRNSEKKRFCRRKEKRSPWWWVFCFLRPYRDLHKTSAWTINVIPPADSVAIQAETKPGKQLVRLSTAARGGGTASAESDGDLAAHVGRAPKRKRRAKRSPSRIIQWTTRRALVRSLPRARSHRRPIHFYSQISSPFVQRSPAVSRFRTILYWAALLRFSSRLPFTVRFPVTRKWNAGLQPFGCLFARHSARLASRMRLESVNICK